MGADAHRTRVDTRAKPVDLNIMIGGLRGRVRGSAVRGPAASLASQVASLLQFALLLARGGASEATDAYFYLFNLGLMPITMLLGGLMYPQLVSTSPMAAQGM